MGKLLRSFHAKLMWVLASAAGTGLYVLFRAKREQAPRKAAGAVLAPTAPAAPAASVPPVRSGAIGSSVNAPSPQEDWKEHLRHAIHEDPEILGYGKRFWTVPLLETYLRNAHDLTVSPTRIRNALKDLGYHWKNSRYQITPIKRKTAH